VKTLLLVAALVAAASAARGAEIHGRITHPTRPEAAAGLDVQAIGIDETEQTITRETKTDREGRYRFPDLPAPAAYLVRAMYGDVVFPGGSAIFRPGEPAGLEQTIDFEVFDSVADASKLRIASLQWVIARSAGAWQVRQAVVVANPERAVVVVPDDQPSPLRVALAPGHGEVSSGFGRLPPGVTLDGDVATIRGPILPGDTGFSFELVYDVDAPDGELRAPIALPSAVDQLSVYVQDFGIDVDAGALHPARPARQDDVIYQSFLGFDLPAGSERTVVVRALHPATPISPGWVALAAALVAGGLIFFVAGPIAFARTADAGAHGSAPEPSPESHALDAAFADLEHDFETGKLSAADRDRLRADLERERAQAGARETHDPGSAREAPSPACSCGRLPAPGDRFCAGCGSAL
jgi:hypothetical protein